MKRESTEEGLSLKGVRDKTTDRHHCTKKVSPRKTRVTEGANPRKES